MNFGVNDLVVAVLLNYNQNDYTLKCVESLLKSDYINLKVLLVDNGSTRENVIELGKKLPINENLIFKTIKDNRGYAQGTNYGLEEGQKLNPKYYLIINNDTIIDEQAVSELVKTSKEYDDKARVTGKVYHYDEPNKLQFIAFNYVNRKKLQLKAIGVNEIDNGQYESLTELDMMDDIFVLQPLELYKAIGGYSPYLWVNGVNVDISLKAINAGYKLVFCSKAKLWHKGSVSLGGRDKNPRLAFWDIQSRLIIRYLHSNKYDFISSYIRIFFDNALRTYLKSKYLNIIGGEDINKYAKAKLRAFSYFNTWLIKKNYNKGYTPF